MKKKPKAIPSSESANNFSRDTLPADLSVDVPCNWSFDNVPENEQPSCCRWEYMRESACVRAGQLRMAASKRFDFTVPWQKLSADEKHRWEKNCNRNRGQPSALFQRGHWIETEMIMRHIREQIGQQKPPDRALRTWFSTIEENLIPSCCSETEGYEVGVFRLYWAYCNNEELIAAFRKWVTTRGNRPKCFASRGEGRPRGAFDPVAALDALAIMRLLKGCTPTEARRKAPELSRRHNGKQFFGKRQGALKIFRVILPWLPHNERPFSWDTKAGRSR